MIPTAATTTCLTFGQLRDYSMNLGTKQERALQYLHISQCELCACAVNGFTAMPFTIAEVNAIHHQVTVKANAAHANPLIFARVLFAVFCAAGIIGFYYFTDSFSHKKEKAEIVQPVAKEIIAPVIPAAPLVKENKKAAAPAISIPSQKEEMIVRTEIPMEEINPLPASLNAAMNGSPDNRKLAAWHSDVIYIYDLKITDYDRLYFNFAKRNFEIRGYTPPHRENDSTADYLADDEVEAVAADRVLKTGLALFSKANYSKALEQFLLLMENNHEDENALFYGAICCYNLGKYKAAIRSFEEILKDPHSAFGEEAKWNLALTQLKTGERGKAAELLSSIVSDKGFYAKKAGEKLKSL
jgi:hypothetical protein